jgi:hypothetical protein
MAVSRYRELPAPAGPARPRRVPMTRPGVIAVVLVMAALGGCVGAMRSHLDWVTVAPETRTKAEVMGRFGEPLRKTQEGGRDVWYYRLSTTGLAPGRAPVTAAPNSVFALILPVWWITRPEENTRFVFDGDTVASAAELTRTTRGFYCGLNVTGGNPFFCGRTP